MSEFYMIIDQKYFPEFWGHVPPSPTPGSFTILCVYCSVLRWRVTDRDWPWLTMTYLHRWWRWAAWSCRHSRRSAPSRAAADWDTEDRRSLGRIHPATDRRPASPALSIHSRLDPSCQASVWRTTRRRSSVMKEDSSH